MGNTPNIRFKGFTDDWEQRKLPEFVTFFNGLTYTPDDVEETGTLVLRSSNVKNGEIVDADNVYVNDKVVTSENVQEGDIIVVVRNGSRALIGKHAQIKDSMPNTVIGAFMSGMRSEHSSFVNALLDTSAFENEIAKNMGATINQITGYMFSRMEFMIPSGEEQQKIGEYFQGLDDLITLHQRKCDETKKLKKFMLQKMFPKKDEKKPEIRFAGFTDDWEQRKLGDIITEYKETVDSDCTLPILTSSKTEGVILQEKHFGRKQQHDITGYNILPRNYCTYRNRSDGVDFTFNINKCCDKGIISKFYPVFSGKNSDVFFLSLVLNNSEEVVREIAYTCTGTGQKVLSFLDLQKMKVRVPNFDEQKEIVAYFESLDHLITLHQRKSFFISSI